MLLKYKRGVDGNVLIQEVEQENHGMCSYTPIAKCPLVKSHVCKMGVCLLDN